MRLVKVLRSLVDMSANLVSQGHTNTSVRPRSRDVMTNARRHRLGFFALAVYACSAPGSNSSPPHLQPTPRIYGKISSLLCASLLLLSAVHAVWQHTLITPEDGRRDCGVSLSVGYFFSFVWPRLQLIISSLAPALALTILSVIALVYSLRLHLRWRKIMRRDSAPSTSITASIPLSDIQRRPIKTKHRPDTRRLADARREYVELAHLNAAIAVAFTRVLHLSYALVFMHDHYAVLFSRPAFQKALHDQSEAADLTRVRRMSLMLLCTQIAVLIAHAAALPIAALISSRHTLIDLLCRCRKRLIL